LKISFIISYKESDEYRKNNLKHLLNYLSWLLYNDAEIILVEQDSESKINWLSEIKRFEKINHIFIKNDGPFNKNYGYDIGVTKSMGEYIIFNDINIYLKLDSYRSSISLLSRFDIINPYKTIYLLDKDYSNLYFSNNYNFLKLKSYNYILSSDISNKGIIMIKREKYLLLKNYENILNDSMINNLGLNQQTINDLAVQVYQNIIIQIYENSIDTKEINVQEDFKKKDFKKDDFKKDDFKKDSFSLNKIIPKRIFFYWSGNNMSWMRYMTLYTCRKFNPNWEIVLYLSDKNSIIKNWNGPEKQDFTNYKGIDYLNKINDLNIKIEKVEWPDELREKFKDISPIHEGDLFRYYQLYTNGGIYCDMDVLFFRPIDNFYNHIIKSGYDTIIHEDNEYNSTIGFLGSCINNDYYKNLFELGVNNYEETDYQSMGVNLIYKLFLNKPILEKISLKYPNLKIYNLPSSLIYHYDWTEIKYCFSNSIGIKDFCLNSIGYHWYGGGVESQYYNNILNEKNYNTYKIGFSNIVDEINNIKNEKVSVKINIENVVEKKLEVSIVIAYINRKKLLYETLKSISNTKFKNFEVIVVDDGSIEEERIEEFIKEFNFLKVIRIEPMDKWYVNTCIPYNIGIKYAVGDIIMLQNAECLHIQDIISYISKNINDDNYISISAYALNKELTESLPNNIDNNFIHNFKSLPQHTYDHNLMIGWYNHSIYNPTYYHFCSAITRKNLDLLGGFDEKYALGTAYEDNDLLERIKKLKLNILITDELSVIHQWHIPFQYKRPNFNELIQKNKDLFYNMTMIQKDYKINNKNIII
jgi:glycosyltransferase involved in cell wall biosynthesis/mannosyltransferase OCH1-like enzyme